MKKKWQSSTYSWSTTPRPYVLRTLRARYGVMISSSFLYSIRNYLYFCWRSMCEREYVCVWVLRAADGAIEYESHVHSRNNFSVKLPRGKHTWCSNGLLSALQRAHGILLCSSSIPSLAMRRHLIIATSARVSLSARNSIEKCTLITCAQRNKYEKKAISFNLLSSFCSVPLFIHRSRWLGFDSMHEFRLKFKRAATSVPSNMCSTR